MVKRGTGKTGNETIRKFSVRGRPLEPLKKGTFPGHCRIVTPVKEGRKLMGNVRETWQEGRSIRNGRGKTAV